MDSRWADYSPPGAHGPVIWFVTPTEVVDIRMATNQMRDWVRAADVLKARFFIMRYKGYIGLPEGWGVFDTKNLNPDNGHIPTTMPDGKQARPRKMFDTEDTHAPVMWAIAMGAM